MPMLSTERDGRVLVVRVDHPPHNFMNRKMVLELDRLTGLLERDPSLGAVLITGGPPDLFITHYDVAEILAGVEAVGPAPPPALGAAMLAGAGVVRRVPGLRALAERTPARGLLELRRLHDVFVRMGEMDKVFIAAINGNATGGGCELALACDLRYVADKEIRIGLPEMTLGFNPGAGGTQRLTRALGSARAIELMLEGRALSPREAAEVGLVQAVVDPARLLERSVQSAQRMARRAPLAVKGLKRAVYGGASSSLRRGLALERKWFVSQGGRPGAKRAMSVYAEEVERGGVPWADPAKIRRWQEGTAADLLSGEASESDGRR
jgi:enoyl-CoA hydratase